MASDHWSSIQNTNDWRFWIEKTNALLQLINCNSNTDNIYLYANNPYEEKYQLLINKCKGVGWEKLCNFKAFTELPYDMGDIFENTEDYNPDYKILRNSKKYYFLIKVQWQNKLNLLILL